MIVPVLNYERYHSISLELLHVHEPYLEIMNQQVGKPSFKLNTPLRIRYCIYIHIYCMYIYILYVYINIQYIHIHRFIKSPVSNIIFQQISSQQNYGAFQKVMGLPQFSSLCFFWDLELFGHHETETISWSPGW